ncbi:hypothetical protein L226DRAFT_616005 [Lentinus tigrinus ALCF2SS1-7]|uniref:F-box domain-containing protein n=1 Tax=Lentinus tigrinus ALCF2SS1-6 TaxID=1328759 RepID=A0A5C2RVR4_9APHY|nr:hypothetical protein L227DRAFT_603524 [Lentinus tigrinus ALCF2SS1-6]RPD70676.1 hypothetical protein L226DRAFT_616005 [Lentinus tigrinus ALCF2SS1-7]
MATFATLEEIKSSGSFLLSEHDLEDFVGLAVNDLRKASLAKVQEYTARIKTIQDHISELRSIHNGALPLHLALPPELVAEIFRHLPFEYRSDIRLLHVCRLWRILLQKTPEFWASFLSHSVERSRRPRYGWKEGEPLFMTALIRSSPLGVQITGGERHLEILHTAPNHVIRLSSLTLTIGTSHLETLFSILRIKNLRLETLVLNLTCKAHNGLMRTEILDKIRPWVPTGDHFPRLHTLEVNGVLFPTLASPTIKHLRLFGCSRNLCTSPATCSRTNVSSLGALVSGLRRCPALLTCRFITCLPSRITASQQVVVHLPQLQEIFVSSDPSSTRAILETVTFPRTTLLKTGLCITAQDPLLPATPIPTVASLQALSLKAWNSESLTQSQICREGTYEGFSDGQLRLRMGPRRLRWATAVAGAGRSEVVRTLVIVFASLERLTTLELNFGFRIPIVQADWQLVLDSFTRITSLTVRVDSCRNLLRALRRGRNRTLETLSISCLKGRAVHEPLVRTVENGASKHLCLRRLEFRQMLFKNQSYRENASNVPMSASQLARLKAVVAEVVTFPEVRDVVPT